MASEAPEIPIHCPKALTSQIWCEGFVTPAQGDDYPTTPPSNPRLWSVPGVKSWPMTRARPGASLPRLMKAQCVIWARMYIVRSHPCLFCQQAPRPTLGGPHTECGPTRQASDCAAKLAEALGKWGIPEELPLQATRRERWDLLTLTSELPRECWVMLMLTSELPRECWAMLMLTSVLPSVCWAMLTLTSVLPRECWAMLTLTSVVPSECWAMITLTSEVTQWVLSYDNANIWGYPVSAELW